MKELWSMANLLGLPTHAPAVQDVLNQLGVLELPELHDGDAKAYVESHKDGLYVVLTDEAFFRKTEGASIGSGPLLVTNITAYCRALGEYEPFDGELPFGILASDGPDAVRSKMGEPGLFNERAKVERWTRDDIWIFVKYDRAVEAIDRLTLQAPDA